MRGSTILVSAEPKGRFEGIIVSGTPKPGTCMIPTSANVSVGVGRSTYSARTGYLDGARGPVAVLLEDSLQGGTVTQAYVSGAWGMIYWPQAGDELNMILDYQPATGTGGEEFVGALLEIVGASGKLQAKGTWNTPAGAHVSAPFEQLEQLGVALAADYLLWTRYLGNMA
jgi:hypothetical protein